MKKFLRHLARAGIHSNRPGAILLGPLYLASAICSITGVVQGTPGLIVVGVLLLVPATFLLIAQIGSRRYELIRLIAEHLGHCGRAGAAVGRLPENEIASAISEAMSAGYDALDSVSDKGVEACFFTLHTSGDALYPCSVARNWASREISAFGGRSSDTGPGFLAKESDLGRFLIGCIQQGIETFIPDIDRPEGTGTGCLPVYLRDSWPSSKSFFIVPLLSGENSYGALIGRCKQAGLIDRATFAVGAAAADVIGEALASYEKRTGHRLTIPAGRAQPSSGAGPLSREGADLDQEGSGGS
jgi:hypothetical protein